MPAVIGVAMAIETAVISDARGPLWANVVAIFALVAPLVARRRHPILAAATSLLVGLAMSAVLTSIPETVTGVALLVVIFYSVGAWARRWWWLVGWGVAALGAVAMEWASGGGSDSTGGDDEWIVLIWTVGAVALGRISAGWQERLRRTRAVVNELERGRGAAVRLAVAQQREALASELDDPVAHAMTVVCHRGRRRATGRIAHRRSGKAGRRGSTGERRRHRIRGGGGSCVPRRPRGRGQRRATCDRGDRGRAHPPSWERPVGRGGRRRKRRASRAQRHRDRPARARRHLAAVGGTLEWGHCEPSGFRVAALIPQDQR